MACTVTLCNNEINALKKGLSGSLCLYLLTNTSLWSLKAVYLLLLFVAFLN